MRVASIEDLRLAARRRIPRFLFDYLDGGAASEETMRTNEADFSGWSLQQRVLCDVSQRDLSASFLERRHALPLLLAPVGFAGMLAPRGEVQAARAAQAAGIGYCLSTVSIGALEEVAATGIKPLYFQLYALRDRGWVQEMISRAEAVGVDGLFLTVDTAVGSVRERDVRNAFQVAKRPSIRMMADVACHPRWAFDMLGALPLAMGNLPRPSKAGSGGILEQAAVFAQSLDASLTWEFVDLLRSRWKRKLVLKGILSVDDAVRAAERNVDAIVVSNHGGRQLDGARSAISALPDICDAVGDRVEVLFDSGIRRGTHVVKALALGARGCLIGRAYAYGLAANGAVGVRSAIEFLRKEIDISVALMGCSAIAELRRTHVSRNTPAAMWQ
jgi:isopentenyl diphosphate isomerase/L-lactate dehydrogenase-like FMN-dependent dehydrogenase